MGAVSNSCISLRIWSRDFKLDDELAIDEEDAEGWSCSSCHRVVVLE
jgi:hypothetical protein